MIAALQHLKDLTLLHLGDLVRVPGQRTWRVVLEPVGVELGRTVAPLTGDRADLAAPLERIRDPIPLLRLQLTSPLVVTPLAWHARDTSPATMRCGWVLERGLRSVPEGVS